MNAPFDKFLNFTRKRIFGRPQKPPFRRKPMLESLEPRLLLSADVASPAVVDFLAATRDTHNTTAVVDATQALQPTVITGLTDSAYHAGPETGFVQLDEIDSRAHADSQTFFLDLDGEMDVDYRGPVLVRDVDVEAFKAPGQLVGQEDEIISALLASLGEEFAGFEIDFTLDRPANGDYSTIFIGGDGSAFSEYGQFLGLSEQIDAGNLDHGDNAFIFSENIDVRGLSAAQLGAQLAELVEHEAGHLIGMEHAHTVGAHNNPLAEVAFKPHTHVEVAKDVLFDLFGDPNVTGDEDRRITIAGQQYDVHPKILAALEAHPEYYFAGTVGPDGFPDFVMGQGVIHATDLATWLTRILDMAWAAQNDSSFTADEKSQILAWSYGFLTHAAGDHWAHTLVNEFAEGVFPDFVDVFASLNSDQRDFANGLRHFLVEGYIGDVTRGFDAERKTDNGDPNRKVLPNGDVSDDSSPGIPYGAPTRFIYETLIRPFPFDPTPIVKVKLGDEGVLTVDAATDTIARSTGSYLDDGFKVNHKITTSGFTSALNNGVFHVTAVTDTTLTVAEGLADEAASAASGDEKIEVFVPFTDKTRIDVDAATNSFVRTTGSFIADGFVEGQRFTVYGLNNYHGDYLVTTVTALTLTVMQDLDAGNETGSGDEQLVVQGSRGKALNAMLLIRDKVEQLAISRGAREPLGPLVSALVDNLAGGPSAAPDPGRLLTAYLYNWVDEINEGLRNWGDLGLAITRALFDPQSRRDLQNKEGSSDGLDTLTNTLRARTEAGVGMLDVLIAELDDLNGDGSTNDSFINNHLLPMVGLPEELGLLRFALQSVSDTLDQVLEPLNLLFNPIEAAIGQIKEFAKDFIKGMVEERFGFSFEVFDFLTELNSKMDLATVTVGSTVIPIFKPGDHEKLDAFLDLDPGAGHHQAFPNRLTTDINAVLATAGLATRLQADADGNKLVLVATDTSVTSFTVTATTGNALGFGVSQSSSTIAGKASLTADSAAPGNGRISADTTFTVTVDGGTPVVVTVLAASTTDNQLVGNEVTIANFKFSFNDDALAAPNAAAEFDKQTFAAYANSVTLSKMLLLTETPVDGNPTATWANQISALFANVSGFAGYDAKLLNLNGAHGGNVLTATLPGVPGAEGRPWLVSIDADHVWRADSQTTNAALFRISSNNDSASPAQWTADIDAGQTYAIYAAWQHNVTQQLDNLTNSNFPDEHIKPALDARYIIKDGGIAFVTGQPEAVDQRRFAGDPAFAGGIEEDGIAYRLLGTFLFTSSSLSAELSNIALSAMPDVPGNVVAGPLLIRRVSDDQRRRIQFNRNPETLLPEATPGSSYTDNPNFWTDLAYDTGSGNNPLWESAILRPGFRELFVDWQNGALDFPALGDATSPDPNTTVSLLPNPLLSHATPFGPKVADSEIEVAIPDSLKNLILNGLNDLVAKVQSVEGAAPFNVTLPVVNKTLGEIIDLSDNINQDVRLPFVNYFNNDATATFNELFDAIRTLIPDRLAASSALEFVVDLHETISESISLSLGVEADAVGLDIDGTLNLQASVGFVDALNAALPKFTVGIDITPDGITALQDRFYIEMDRVAVTADIHATGLALGAHFGFLGVGVENGTFDLDADVGINVIDPNSDGKITAGELASTPFENLFQATATGALSANLPIRVNTGLGGFVNPNVGSVTLAAPQLFNPGSYDLNFNGNFSDLFEFGDLSAAQILTLLTQLTTQLDELRQTDAIQTVLGLPVLGPALDEILKFTDFAADTLLIDDLDDSTPGNDVPKLAKVGGAPNFNTVQEFAAKLAQILGLSPTAIGANYDASTKLLTFNLNLHQVLVDIAAPLELGFDLEEGLADFRANVDASINAELDFSLVFGVDLNFNPGNGDSLEDFVFIDDAQLSGSIDLAAENLDASARFGFLSIGIVDGSATGNADFSISLSDPGSNSAPASAGRIDLSELGDSLAALDADFNASTNIRLPISAPFLGVTPGPDSTLILDWPDVTDFDTLVVTPPSGFADLFNFNNIDAGTLVSLLGQVANWLEDFRRDFGAQDIPFVGNALDEVLKFADLFNDTLLFDDGDDGADGANKLITDVNAALATARLDTKLRAEADNGRVRLIAIDPSITGFSVSGGSGLGFGGSQTATSVAGRLLLNATSAAPSNGVLASNTSFTVSINSSGAETVTVLASATTGNTGLGNDVQKLLNSSSAPTFDTVQELAQRLVQILGSDLVQYDALTDELTINLNLGNVSSVDNFGFIDIPINFDLFEGLNLGSVAQLSSDSVIRLSAGGGLSLTIGLYLGNEGGITLTESTALSTLKDGIAFSDLLTVAGTNDVSTLFGQLTGDATFRIGVNGAPPVAVTVPRLSGPTRADVNVSNQADSQREATIAVNPANSNNIIASANDLNAVDGIFGSSSSNDSVWVSTDGGNTWARKLIPVPAGAVGGHGDPAIVFSRDGSRAVYVHMVDKDAAHTHVMASAVSLDGGNTWLQANTGVIGSLALDEDGDGI
ncbi:MAG: LEPR-XLL domain-containing protein, partial [Burkholderiales bacterium]